jgi:hypothetical protein
MEKNLEPSTVWTTSRTGSFKGMSLKRVLSRGVHARTTTAARLIRIGGA